MEIVVIVLVVVMMVAGHIGCLIPVIPGPSIAFMSLLVLHFFTTYTLSTGTLWFLGAVVILVTGLDYWFQIYGVKKFGGGKKAVYCTIGGLFVGLIFIPVVGFIVGPFLGALAGGYWEAPNDIRKVFTIAFGALLGFFTGAFLKLFVCIYMAVQLVQAFNLF